MNVESVFCSFFLTKVLKRYEIFTFRFLSFEEERIFFYEMRRNNIYAMDEKWKS